ncbi:Transcriptional regulator, AraC family protein [Minicystis rosea]|nr:Transcriptional regulator, AraC family protein [Minicystis rosea]
MDDQEALYREMAAIVARHVPSDGELTTVIPNLLLSRKSSPSQPMYVTQRPCFALVVQGAKSLTVGGDRFAYGVGEFLVVSLDLPIVSRVTKASRAVPNLGVGLTIDPTRLANVLARVEVGAATARETPRGVAVHRASPLLLEAVVRLLRLLDRPEDIPALAPLYEEEILYRLLKGPCASRLLHVARADTPSTSIVKATTWLRERYAEPLRIGDLAKQAGMSASSLHHHFKAVTAMSPLQYQKQLRLSEGRRLLLVEHLDVGTASYRVGYKSPSQFTREYTRLFGRPPRRDARGEG